MKKPSNKQDTAVLIVEKNLFQMKEVLCFAQYTNHIMLFC